MSDYFPPLEGCVDCEKHGRCVCWTDRDQEEFEREFNDGKPKGCTHIGICPCEKVNA